MEMATKPKTVNIRATKLKKVDKNDLRAKPKKKKEKEEWEMVEASIRLEFWQENKISKSKYHHGFAIRGWRESMEDALDFNSSVSQDLPNLFAVFDGHGGSTCAEFCRKNLLSQISEREDLTLSPKLTLADSFLNIDSEFNEQFSDSESGTTATVLFVHPVEVKERNDRTMRMRRKSFAINHEAALKELKHQRQFEFFVASVGDSRAVLIYKDGSVVALSEDHNLERKDELARITEGKGLIRVDPEFDELLVYSAEAQRGLAVTRTIGDRAFKPLVTAFPDVKDGIITSDCAFILLASDGLWAKVSNEEVGKMLKQYGAVKGTRNLANLANKRGIMDNISLLAVDCQKLVETFSSAIDENPNLLRKLNPNQPEDL